MREIKIDWRSIELKKGDTLVIYKGLKEGIIAVKGNIKRDKRVKKIFNLIVDQY